MQHPSRRSTLILVSAKVSGVIYKAGAALQGAVHASAKQMRKGFAQDYQGFKLASLCLTYHFDRMESHEVLREVLEKCNAKQIAADMGLSLSLIYKWAEPAEMHGSGTANPLDRIEALVRCSNDVRIVQWICERAGGFFIRNPKGQWPHPHFLVPATNQIVQEFADLLAVIAAAAGDNTISKQEAKAIRARWEELKCVTEGFVRCCEEGNFSALRKELPSQEKS